MGLSMNMCKHQGKREMRLSFVIIILLILPQPQAAPEKLSKVHITPGPSSGIVLEEAPGLLLTERRLITQTIFVKLDPEAYLRAALEQIQPREKRSAKQFWDKFHQIQMKTFNQTELPKQNNDKQQEIWFQDHVIRTKDSLREILHQLKKTFISRDELKLSKPGTPPQRHKRFVTLAFVLGLGIAALVGAILGTTLSIANAATVAQVNRKQEELRASLGAIQKQLNQQTSFDRELLTLVNDTVVIQGQHAELLSHSIAHNEKQAKESEMYYQVIDPTLYHTQNYLRQVQSNINNLIRAQVPLYFVSSQMIRTILTKVHHLPIDDMQVKIALDLGGALPLYIDEENLHISFLLTLPFVATSGIYQTKRVLNVGTWKEGTYAKINAPEIIAYQPWGDGNYLVPKLDTCVRFRDHNFLCPGKPFAPDASSALCGVQEPPHQDKICSLTVSRPEVEEFNTVIELAQDQWLVSSRLENLTVMYALHGTYQVLPLPYRISLITVPKDMIVTIGDQSLFYVSNEGMNADVEMVNTFAHTKMPDDPDLEYLLQHKPNHTIQVKLNQDAIAISQHMYSHTDQQIMFAKGATQRQWLVTIIGLVGLALWTLMLTVIVARNEAYFMNFISGRRNQARRSKDLPCIIDLDG